MGLQGRDWGLLPASLPPPAMGQQLSVCLSMPRTEPGAGDRAVNETGPIPAVLEVTVHEGQDPSAVQKLGDFSWAPGSGGGLMALWGWIRRDGGSGVTHTFLSASSYPSHYHHHHHHHQHHRHRLITIIFIISSFPHEPWWAPRVV